jgi:peptidoglycan/xylan/chitin deacetylase (PgdA/CDA1 family)
MYRQPTMRQKTIATFFTVIVIQLVAIACTPATSPPAISAPPMPIATVSPDTALAVVTPADTATAIPQATNTPFRLPDPTNTPFRLPDPSPTVAETDTPTPTQTATAAPTTTPTTTPASPPTAALPLPELMLTMPQPTPPTSTYSDTVRVPILMYHYISVPPEGENKYRIDLSVTPENFREQMQYLADNGYTPVDLYDISLAIARKQELPEKPVAITFDDGYRDNYENAFPVLQELGFKATFFVITGFIDQENPQYMSWEMVEELSRAGMRIESHSVSHPDMPSLDRDAQLAQVQASQATIAEHIGYTPRYFCYPGGNYDPTTVDLLRELDTWGAVTTQSGNWHEFDNRYTWGRVRMRFTTTLIDFENLLILY